MERVKKPSIDDVTKIKGVEGVALVGVMGDIEKTTIDDIGLNKFISFLSGIAGIFEATASQGKLRCITLKGSSEDNLTYYKRDDQALSVLYSAKIPIRRMNQLMNDLSQRDSK